MKACHLPQDLVHNYIYDILNSHYGAKITVLLDMMPCSLYVHNNVLEEYADYIFRVEDSSALIMEEACSTKMLQSTYLPDFRIHFQDCNHELHLHYTVKLVRTNIYALNNHSEMYLVSHELKDIIEEIPLCPLLELSFLLMNQTGKSCILKF
jgi:hypothetical protein